MTIYKSRIARLRYVLFPFLALFAVVAVAIAPDIWMKALFVLCAGFLTWYLLNALISLTVTDDGCLLFVSTRKTTEYAVRDIQQVRLRKSEDGDYAFLDFDFGHRTIRWQHEEKENREIIGQLKGLWPLLVVVYD